MRPAKPGDRCVVINDGVPANVGKLVTCDSQCPCDGGLWKCTSLEPFYDFILGGVMRLPAGCGRCFRKQDIVPLEDPDAGEEKAASRRPVHGGYPAPAMTGRPYFTRR